MSKLLVPNIADVYFKSMLASHPTTSGLSDVDFDPNVFVPYALSMFAEANTIEFGIGILFATTGDIKDTDDVRASMYSAAEELGVDDPVAIAELQSNTLKDDMLTTFEDNRGDVRDPTCRAMWTILIYLGSKALREDKERFAAEMKELGL